MNTNTILENSHPVSTNQTDWIRTIRRYILFVFAANLIWEFVQLPLYTIWETGTTGELVFAAVHCTGGDLLIALSTLLIALCVLGNRAWPTDRFWEVLIAAVILGICYTIFSEWLNIEVRKAWAYSELMPVIPIINAGLSPILQWIVIPIVGLVWSRKSTQ